MHLQKSSIPFDLGFELAAHKCDVMCLRQFYQLQAIIDTVQKNPIAWEDTTGAINVQERPPLRPRVQHVLKNLMKCQSSKSKKQASQNEVPSSESLTVAYWSSNKEEANDTSEDDLHLIEEAKACECKHKLVDRTKDAGKEVVDTGDSTNRGNSGLSKIQYKLHGTHQEKSLGRSGFGWKQIILLIKILSLVAMVLILMAKIIPHILAPPYYYMVSTARVRDEAKFHHIQLGMTSTAMAGTTTKRIIVLYPIKDAMVVFKPDVSEILAKHAEVVRLIKTGGQYGGFDAIMYLMGNRTAELLMKNHFVKARPLPAKLPSHTVAKTSSRNASSSKRTLKDLDWDDDSRISSSVDEGGSKKRVRQSN
ncbi:hypothetical protein EV702DRAFT_1045529 [Suillus placidus]|uniref:Uncharacterized protein n=1 Tax=Suillus placidus TaxID=48579 RepID=A0A9P7D1U8_9AGAM|nr:hypothetical protein EV702DRAFT_1045529 [Suillus placidus]